MGELDPTIPQDLRQGLPLDDERIEGIDDRVIDNRDGRVQISLDSEPKPPRALYITEDSEYQ